MPRYRFTDVWPRIFTGLRHGDGVVVTRHDPGQAADVPGSTVVLAPGDEIDAEQPLARPLLAEIAAPAPATAPASAPAAPAPSPTPAPIPAAAPAPAPAADTQETPQP